MGVDCSFVADNEPPLARIPPPEPVEIYGDFFDSDTRSILAISEMSGAPHKHILIDRFRRDH